MNSPWRIELFGGLRLRQDGGPTISRFQTRKTAALLAYLAFYRDKIVAREILADLLWPDHDPDAARNSLRVALTSLRRQLEPPGIPSGAVLVADRASIHLNPASFSTDVADFDAALREERAATDDGARTAAMIRAVDLYRGPLLFGWYEEWIDLEQARLAEVYSGALRRITTNVTRAGDYELALEYAQRAVTADPLREETNRNLMRLYAVLGQPAAAREQYRRLENLLQKDLRAQPSTATRELMKQIAALPAQGVAGPPRPPAAAVSGTPGQTSGDPLPPQPKTPAEQPNPATVSLHSTVPVAGNVPLQFTRFMGREAEMARLEEMLRPAQAGGAAPTRLVTLTGPGGAGKTRLAVEVAQAMRDRGYANRVWVVSLADLTEGAQIGPALLAGFRLTEIPGRTVLDQVVSLLAGDPSASAMNAVLLILDNLEQIADPASIWVSDLLSRLPNLTIATTSRHPLMIGGEQVFVVPPLPAPRSMPGATAASSGPGLDLEALSLNPSVALFTDRARAVRPDFQITARNATAIAELCRRLDGLPLAIELAAAGVRLLSPSQMVERLNEHGDILTSERRDLNARHRSLRAVMDESYRLLAPDAKSLFARLAVFEGGWTMDAAQAVCGDTASVDLLDQLQYHSLVLTSDTDAGIRFRLLETVRQYADSHLTATERGDIQSAHARYFQDFAERAGAVLRGAEATATAIDEAIEADIQNLRAAIRWSLINQPITALRIGAALWRFWYACGGVDEGFALTDSAVRAVDDISATAAIEPAKIRFVVEARHGAGRLALSAGNGSAACGHFARATELLPLLRAGETALLPSFEATLHLDYAIALEARGEYGAAAATYERLIAWHRSRSDRWAEACDLSSLGAVHSAAGNAAAAGGVYEESAALRRSLGDRWGGSVDFTTSSRALDAAEAAFAAAVGESEDAEAGIAASFLQLGHIASEQGDYGAALPLLRESLAAYRRMGDESGSAIASERVSLTALRQGDLVAAHRAAEEALLLRRTGGDPANSDGPRDGFAQSLLLAIDKAGDGILTDLM